MDFSLDETQNLFKQSVEKFVEDEYAFNDRQNIVAGEHGFLPRHWSVFAELGWLAMPFPEQYGGLGGGSEEVMLLMEQFGRRLVMGPFLSTVVLAGRLLIDGANDGHKQSLISAIAGGGLKLALAYAEPQSRYNVANCHTTASADTDWYILNGHKSVVFYAGAADKLVVSARTSGKPMDSDGVSLFLVDADTQGVAIQNYTTQDGGRAAEVRFNQARIGSDRLLGRQGQGVELLERAMDFGNAALCAEAVGAMWAVQEQTLAYTKIRRQFGAALSSFQALQHRMVDMYMKCELAQSMLYDITTALQEPDTRQRQRRCSGAKAAIASYAREVSKEGIQIHGGIGMTMDLPIGHYFKRITMINATFGDSAFHVDRYRTLSND